MNGWLDLVIVQAFEYFSGIMAQGYQYISQIATIFGLFGIMWCGFQLAMSRGTIKKMFWDTIFNWTIFWLLFCAYPLITIAVGQIGTALGMNLGNGKEAIVKELTNLGKNITTSLDNVTKNAQILFTQKTPEEIQQMLGIDKDSDIYNELQNLSNKVNKVNDNLTKSSEKNKFVSEKRLQYYEDFLNKYEQFGYYRWDIASDKQQANNESKKLKQNILKDISSMVMNINLLKALDSVLIVRSTGKEDESTGDIKLGKKIDDYTNSYVDLDIWLKAGRAGAKKDTYYISPSALLRVSLLCCDVMYSKEDIRHTNKLDQIWEGAGITHPVKVIIATGKSIEELFQWAYNMLLVTFCSLVLILSTIFCEIQYVMTIIEYTLVCAIGAVFIPLMLFDGTKDIPKKFIPVFTAFLIKILVMTLCMMFVFYTLIENTINQITSTGGINFVTIADICFNAILCYVLTQNAPKIAQTIMTGQPQLSMGEAMQAAGTAAATGAVVGKGAVGATRKAANAGINATGNIKRGIEGNKAAKEGVKEGKSEEEIKATGDKAANSKETKALANKAGREAFTQAAIAQPAKAMAQRAKANMGAKLQSYLNGKTKMTLDPRKGWNDHNDRGSNGNFSTANGGAGGGQGANGGSAENQNTQGQGANGGAAENNTAPAQNNNPYNNFDAARDNINFNTAMSANGKDQSVPEFLKNQGEIGRKTGKDIAQKYLGGEKQEAKTPNENLTGKVRSNEGNSLPTKKESPAISSQKQKSISGKNNSQYKPKNNKHYAQQQRAKKRNNHNNHKHKRR